MNAGAWFVQSSAALVRPEKEDRDGVAMAGIGQTPPRSGRREERMLELCEGMIDIAAALFNVQGRELRRAGRTSLEVARVRQIAMYVTHVVLRLNMTDIGKGFGRDRTTVMHACHLIEDMRDDEDFDRMVVLAERVALAAFRNRLEV